MASNARTETHSTRSFAGHSDPTCVVHPPVESIKDVLDSSCYSDNDVAQCTLQLWRDSENQRLSGVSPSRSPPNSHFHNAHVRLQVAAVRIFGEKSLQGDTHAAASCFRIANPAVLRRRYRQIALRVHPDKNTSPHAAEAFQVVQSCFDVAAAAGADVALWAWCSSFAQTVGGGEEEEDRSGGNHGRGDDAASVRSSLFSSSSSLASLVSCSDAASSSEPSCSTASSDLAREARDAFRKQTSSESRLHGTRGATQSLHSATPLKAEAPPTTATWVPEPPTVIFAEVASPSDGAKRETDRRVPKCTTWRTPISPLPPPPPPVVFNDDTDVESGNSDGDLPPPPADMNGLHDFLDGQHPSTDFQQRFGDAEPAHASLRRRSIRRHHNESGDPMWRNHRSCTSTTDHREPDSTTCGVPPPPSVFNNSPLCTPAPQKIKKGTPSPTSGKGVRSHRHRPELPTLAELLARLDEDEDSVEGHPENARAFTNAPAASTWEPQCPLPTRSATTSRYGDGAGFSDRLTDINLPLREHAGGKRGNARELFDTEGADGSCANRDASVRALLFSSRMPISTATTRSETRDTLGRQIAGQLERDVTAMPTTRMQSRRIGGGEVKRRAGLGVAGSRSGEQRCACGKARRGQCFLCE